MLNDLPTRARIFFLAVVLAGWAGLISQLLLWESDEPLRLVLYIIVFAIASCLKVWLPGITGTMSVNYVFVLLAVVELALPEALLMVVVGTVVQMYWHAEQRPQLKHVLFNVASLAIATLCAYSALHSPFSQWLLKGSMPLLLALSALAYFTMNTLSIAAIVGLTESSSAWKIWRECYFWSLPYYLLGAAVAGGLAVANRYVGWQVTLVAMPALFLMYKSYGLYLSRLESEAKHAKDMASLHLRTIEALAAAIEAKDEGTHEHLERVQTYAVEMGKAIGLPEEQLNALRAASILHDIGKLAVPEHIISKPGKLTPEEFEKMKIHPVVGAEILERVQFPYPVAPIVRHHHEKWNGNGYPDGLSGEDIPIGARILSMVDCLDALATDRPYRRALPLEKAMAFVVDHSGKDYDPALVAILHEHYIEWEAKAKTEPGRFTKLDTNIQVPTGGAPEAGFEESAVSNNTGQLPEGDGSFVSQIAAARQEVQTLYELSLELGTSLSLEETLSVLDIRLSRLIPYDTITVLTRKHNHLVPAYISGNSREYFAQLEPPLGEGLSGWVAETGKSIINGNPAVEAGYLSDDRITCTLRSSVAVPLAHGDGIVGTLAVHSRQRAAFTPDHCRILMAIAPKLALAVSNAASYESAKAEATTDGLTGLPNARTLFLLLNEEVERCRRVGSTLYTFVCDLDKFKQVNDRFGHLAGNEILKLIAQRFKACCRNFDVVARMGGDEFVFVLPGLDGDAVDNKVGVIERVAQQAGLEVCKESILSTSVGTASYPADGSDAEQLLAVADRRMYLAKQSRKKIRIVQDDEHRLAQVAQLNRLNENLSTPAPPALQDKVIPYTKTRSA